MVPVVNLPPEYQLIKNDMAGPPIIRVIPVTYVKNVCTEVRFEVTVKWKDVNRPTINYTTTGDSGKFNVVYCIQNPNAVYLLMLKKIKEIITTEDQSKNLQIVLDTFISNEFP